MILTPQNRAAFCRSFSPLSDNVMVLKKKERKKERKKEERKGKEERERERERERKEWKAYTKAKKVKAFLHF